jgi:hypothetical protein
VLAEVQFDLSTGLQTLLEKSDGSSLGAAARDWAAADFELTENGSAGLPGLVFASGGVLAVSTAPEDFLNRCKPRTCVKEGGQASRPFVYSVFSF